MAQHNGAMSPARCNENEQDIADIKRTVGELASSQAQSDVEVGGLMRNVALEMAETRTRLLQQYSTTHSEIVELKREIRDVVVFVRARMSAPSIPPSLEPRDPMDSSVFSIEELRVDRKKQQQNAAKYRKEKWVALAIAIAGALAAVAQAIVQGTK